jgi:hypothetical protein
MTRLAVAVLTRGDEDPPEPHAADLARPSRPVAGLKHNW